MTTRKRRPAQTTETTVRSNSTGETIPTGTSSTSSTSSASRTGRAGRAGRAGAGLETEGTVIECLRSATFKVELANGHQVLAHISGKVRRHHIKILPYDRVLVELSPYDLTRGRILYRYRS